ncbi:hypothetical protein GGS23DRAFT_604741 [Durotheca rogersii]|uniref:uncharacterized protein n=1 Tax=Durotheca rogersii TaxID=419775 RepID=UPI00221FA267|nr:uncharacterized protein GGS23DRAFT_604741 [Durotheca rogersii]KAI5863726.1 hypothetical protein GGS23DRAFT_604741 [Durotheca rogersii]
MRSVDVDEDDELGALEDKTEPLTLRSRRTERARKRQARKAGKTGHQPYHYLMSLPYELVIEILSFLRPSDIFNLQRVNRSFHLFITDSEGSIARAISSWRYVCLGRCFRSPVLIEQMDPAIRVFVQSPHRQDQLNIYRRFPLHVQPPDPGELCTCLTCLQRWLSLCLVVDFAHWQRNLDIGEPIPMIPPGRLPEWNRALVTSNAAIVRKALRSPLWHARLLETHLDSTTRSIRRHTENKGNKRQRFFMSKEDLESGSDRFLAGPGPPSLDIPYHRDNYYMLEAYLPERAWNATSKSWTYVPAEQHDKDVEYIKSTKTRTYSRHDGSLTR